MGFCLSNKNQTNVVVAESNSIVSVDDEATVKAKNELNLKADNATTVTNIVGDVTGKNIVGAGTSYGEIEYKVNNIAAIADNDKTELSALIHEGRSIKERNLKRRLGEPN